MTYEQQDEAISEGLRLLKGLFPTKNVNVFVPPYYRVNADTHKVCEKHGLQISGSVGEVLENVMEHGSPSLIEGKLYRFRHLDLVMLRGYIQQAYTVRKNGRVVPSLGMMKTCVKLYRAQDWYIYAYREFETRLHAYKAYEYIRDNIPHDKNILEVACGAGGMLYRLYADGFVNLSGYDYDEKSIKVCRTVAMLIDAPIEFRIDDAYSPQSTDLQDVIVWVNGMYHLENYTLDMFFEKHVSMAREGAYFIFDMVDQSYDYVKNNEYCTQDWRKPDSVVKRPSEYKIRMNMQKIMDVATKWGCRLIRKCVVSGVVPRIVCIFRRIC